MNDHSHDGDQPLNCRGCTQHLQEYIDGDMPRDLALRVFLHVRECPACEAKLAQWQDLVQTLAQLAAPGPAGRFRRQDPGCGAVCVLSGHGATAAGSGTHLSGGELLARLCPRRRGAVGRPRPRRGMRRGGRVRSTAAAGDAGRRPRSAARNARQASRSRSPRRVGRASPGRWILTDEDHPVLASTVRSSEVLEPRAAWRCWRHW